MHIAILGCGQLSRMLALAGIPMGFQFSFIAEENEDTRCVDTLGSVLRWQPGQSVDELFDSLTKPDVVTVEKEQADVNVLRALEHYCAVHPRPEAFALCQHRHKEKQLLERLNIPCSAYTFNKSASLSVSELSLPMVVKSCRDGYDGKNQWVLKTHNDVTQHDLNRPEGDVITESWVAFEKEVSQVSVRGKDGCIKHYPLTQNEHNGGILEQSIAPASNIPQELITTAQDYVTRIMEDIDYVGVLAMECFLVKGTLMVNELAPRVHNSGHWTQAGAETCQFSNHIRAISGVSIGRTECHRVAGMVNLLGTPEAPSNDLPENASLHWYGKTVRPRRKLGHVNFTHDSAEELSAQMHEFRESLE